MTNETKFKVGDKVRITRKAASHELGWENDWVSYMDKAVGNVGTVKSINDHLEYDVTVSGPKVPSFGYPSFVLELVKDIKDFKVGQKVKVNYTPKSMWNGVGFVERANSGGRVTVRVNGMVGGFESRHLTVIEEPNVVPSLQKEWSKFKGFDIGDQVQVKYGYGWDGEGTITRLSTEIDEYVVRYNTSKRLGSFHASNLTLIAKENTIETFKIGDQVRAPGWGTFDSPSTVVKVIGRFVYIRPNNKPSDNWGGFYPRNLKFEPVAESVVEEPKLATSVFAIAKNLAVELAKSTATVQFPGGKVNADLVQSELSKLGYSSSDLGNAAGVLFRGKYWQKMDNRTKSTRKGNRSREITNWGYYPN